MKPFVFLVVVVVVVVVCSPSFVLTDSGLRGPPHTVGEMIPKYFAKVGDRVTLDCPIDSDQPESIYYEWYKDDEAITLGWDRFRVISRKLRIRGVVGDDGGRYACKAVNGFGSKELKTRLVVLDANGAIVGGFEDETSKEKISGMRPSFTEVTQPTFGTTFRQTVGSSLTLRCNVDGEPFPSVSWFKVKDGVQLARVNGQQLDLTSINFVDNGTYVCRAENKHGEVNASFILEVIDRGMKGPRIISLEPSNLTVARGQLIHFRCLISSDTVPSIQWLRELGEQESGEVEGVISMQGGRYKTISSANSAIPMQNGSYLSELKLQAESRTASGSSYVCLATNNLGGVDLQKSFLSILPVEENDPLFPIGVLIAIPSTLMILFTGLALVICCVRRAQNGETNVTPTVTTTTTYATPRDATNDYHTPPHPFYNPRPQIRNCRDGVPPNGPPHILPISGQPYFTKENISSSNAKGHVHVPHLASPAYASVPICETPGTNTSTFGVNNRAPPLPSRPNFNPSSRDRNNYNNQGLLTQPLLTQTASSSDSRDSRQSASYRAEFTNHRPIDHWCSSGGSDASSERKHSRNHQIRL